MGDDNYVRHADRNDNNPSHEGPDSSPWVSSVWDEIAENLNPVHVLICPRSEHPRWYERTSVSGTAVGGEDQTVPVLRVTPLVLVRCTLRIRCSRILCK
jgi:hypothetical protein